MKRFNWGTGIIAFYVGFVVMIMALVVMSMRQKVDLATDAYYAEELVFQDKIDKINNAKALAQPVNWLVGKDGIQINFPQDLSTGKFSGKVKLYCPADNGKDRVFDINISGNEMFIPAKSIPSGRYTLQIDWEHLQKKYWSEGVIVM